MLERFLNWIRREERLERLLEIMREMRKRYFRGYGVEKKLVCVIIVVNVSPTHWKCEES